jgi:muramoyltetrapeptide carboxypeptidase
MGNEDLRITSSRLESLGYEVRLHPQNFQRSHQFAGCDSQRAAALQAILCDPELSAVMFAKGGYGTLRILDNLDYDCIASVPKIVIGYSDATGLLLDLHTKANLVTYHGPMLYDLIPGIDSDTWNWFEAVLTKKERLTQFYDLSSGVRVLRAGEGEGELIGGNLTLLVNLLGTNTQFQTAGRLLFIEDYDEHLYSIDRMFVHLKRSGRLSNIVGLIIGQMSKISDDKIPFGYSIDEIILEHCSGTKFPIVAGFPFGHGGKQLTIPIGIRAKLDADTSTGVSFELLEAAVN